MLDWLEASKKGKEIKSIATASSSSLVILFQLIVSFHFQVSVVQHLSPKQEHGLRSHILIWGILPSAVNEIQCISFIPPVQIM